MVLQLVSALRQLQSLAALEHGRAIPSADAARNLDFFARRYPMISISNGNLVCIIEPEKQQLVWILNSRFRSGSNVNPFSLAMSRRQTPSTLDRCCDYPLVRCSSISFLPTSSQTAANSRSSCLTKASSAVVRCLLPEII